MAERSDNVYKNDIQPRSREQFVIGLRHSSAVGYITCDSRFMVDWENILLFTSSSFAFHGTKFSHDRNSRFIIFSSSAIFALILSTFKCRMYIQLVTPIAEFLINRVHAYNAN